jgi:hypothetical protein
MDRTRFGDQLADLVVPICYGIRGAQSGHLMWMYKHPTAPVRRNRTLLAMLLVAALAVHERCIEHRLDRAIGAWATVPSTCGRDGEHPLHRLARTARLSYPEIGLSTDSRADADQRATRVDRFVVHDQDTARGRHVLLVDDTWATGARSQSAALALKHAGADMVTTLVLARWLNPYDHAPTAEFVHSRLVRDYDPLVCPVSGGSC